MSRTLSHLGFSIVALAALGGPCLVAQQSTTTLRGRVTDAQTGAPKAGVTVSITNPNTNFNRTLVTDSQGRFIFFSLPVGQYNINYSFGGQSYKTARTGLLGQEIDASFKWPSQTAGATVTVVAVSATSQTVDTTNAQVGASITEETLSTMPTVARDINQAAVLAPGIQLVAGSAVDPTKKSSSYIQTGEGQGRGTNFALDGGDNNSTDVGGYVLAMPFDAVGELQVVTNQYKAEFGRSTSGFFNVVSKSGTNDFNGIVSGQFQNEKMRAYSADEGEKAKSKQGIYSATVSGPIIKDKLFYMISTEQTNGDSSPVFTFSDYAFSLDPSLRGIKYELTKKSVYAKLDWNVSPDINAAFTYGYSQDTTANQAFPRTSTYNGNVLASALGTGSNQTWKVGGKLTWTLSPSTVWESNMGYFDYKNGISPHDQGPYGGAPTDIFDNHTGTFPRLDTENLGMGGMDPNAIQNTGIKRFTWKNDLTYTTGSHTIKGGFDYNLTHYAAQQLFFNETGVYGVRVAGTGVNYANAHTLALDADQNVLRFSLTANGYQNGISFKQYGIYLQDDWNVSPKLSLYGGIRVDWDTQLDYLKQYDGMYAQIRKNTLDWSGVDADHPAADPAWNSGKAPKGKTYVSPRIQGIYRPNGDDNFTLKFGIGQFVAQTIDNVVGFSRSLGNRCNGLPSGSVWNNAALAYNGMAQKTTGYYTSSFNAGPTGIYVNGHEIVLPVALTPYNLANNPTLRNYFKTTVDSWLTTATADTDGKSLLESDFQYPTSWSYNIGAAYRFNERQAMEATLIYTKSKHLSVQGTLDGSGARVNEYDSAGNMIADTVFYSNQTSTSLQLQVKYAYSSPNTNFIATLAVKDNKSGNGGSIGSFDNSGNTDFYGTSCTYTWKENKERRSPGSEVFSGSFSYSYRFDFGTMISFLGLWHSGKAYDVFDNYPASMGANHTADAYNPIVYDDYKEGCWAMNIDMRLSHKFSFGKKIAVEPYVVVQNLLNNFDYAANYEGTRNLSDGTSNPSFGSRLSGWAYMPPRTAAIGAKITF